MSWSLSDLRGSQLPTTSVYFLFCLGDPPSGLNCGASYHLADLYFDGPLQGGTTFLDTYSTPST